MRPWLIQLFLALLYTFLLVGSLAWLLRRRLAPRAAVWVAFFLSFLGHGIAIPLLTEPERWAPLLLLFWLLPHLLALPLLLVLARLRPGF
jgi:hypothetical protein